MLVYIGGGQGGWRRCFQDDRTAATPAPEMCVDNQGTEVH